jgi:hypothetical protein
MEQPTESVSTVENPVTTPVVERTFVAGPDKATLFRKMAEVLGEVRRVPERGRNTFHNYPYATESDLLDELRPSLSRHGIAVFVNVAEVERRPGGPNGDFTQVKLEITFACGDTGETFTVSWYGEGQDKFDKGLYKAYTGAIKYALMKIFLVSTGDDPEQHVDDGDGPQTGQATARAAQPQRNQPAARPAQPQAPRPPAQTPRPAQPPRSAQPGEPDGPEHASKPLAERSAEEVKQGQPISREQILERVRSYVAEAKKLGLKDLPPVDESASLDDLKAVGNEYMKAVLAARPARAAGRD